MRFTRHIATIYLVAWFTGPAHASSEKLCRELYRLSDFLRASHCYEQLARSKRGPLNVVHKIEVGLWLTNAARNLSKAAAKEKDQGKAALYRERAAALCQEYLKRKLHDTPSSKKRVESMLLRLKSSVGYATLTVSSGSPKASIQVAGYKYKRRVRENFIARLRPGTYTLTITYSGDRKTTKVVTLSPNKPELVSLKPPPPVSPPIIRPPPPLKYKPSWPLIITAVGGGVVVAGAVMLGVGLGSTQQKRDELAQTGNKDDPATTQKIGQLDADVRLQTTMGYAFLGSGLAITAAGILLWSFLPKKERRTMSGSYKPMRTPLVTLQ